MTTATPTELLSPHSGVAAHPVRSVLRSTFVLAVSLGLTVAVLMALASVVDTWA